jgi:hypothetical protein
MHRVIHKKGRHPHGFWTVIHNTASTGRELCKSYSQREHVEMGKSQKRDLKILPEMQNDFWSDVERVINFAMFIYNNMMNDAMMNRDTQGELCPLRKGDMPPFGPQCQQRKGN